MNASVRTREKIFRADIGLTRCIYDNFVGALRILIPDPSVRGELAPGTSKCSPKRIYLPTMNVSAY